MKTMKIDLTVNSSRPDLEVTPRLPGAYVVTKTGIEPDLNDHAMKERTESSNKPLAVSDKPKEDVTPSEAEGKTE